MKRFFCCLLLCAVPVLAQNTRPASLLPQTFSGWELSSSTKIIKNAVQAVPTNAALLKEFGFDGFESATYTRDGRSLQVKAARFADATGAYGALTFYSLPEMQAEQIGDQAV